MLLITLEVSSIRESERKNEFTNDRHFYVRIDPSTDLRYNVSHQSSRFVRCLGKELLDIDKVSVRTSYHTNVTAAMMKKKNDRERRGKEILYRAAVSASAIIDETRQPGRQCNKEPTNKAISTVERIAIRTRDHSMHDQRDSMHDCGYVKPILA